MSYWMETLLCSSKILVRPWFSAPHSEQSQRMNYDMLAKRVAGHLDTDPYLLQFFNSLSYRYWPGYPFR